MGSKGKALGPRSAFPPRPSPVYAPPMPPSDTALRSAFADIAFPALQGGRAAELMALNRQFDRSQFWPPAQMRAAQFLQLNQLIAHATATVPFYATRLRAAGIDSAQPLTEDAWRRLPPLTRQDVQSAGPRLNASSVPPSHGATSEVASGGSTGVPVRIRKTALDNLFWNALHIREEIWHREDTLGDIVRLRRVPPGASEAQKAQIWSPDGMTVADWGPPVNQIWRTGKMHVLESTQSPAIQIAYLQRHTPAYIFTNPSNLRLLLTHMRERAITLPGLKSVWTLSEAVDDTLRTLCRDVLGVRIVHNYTAAETGWMALQCPQSDVLHVQSESCLLEIVDDANHPVSPGQTGRVLVTPLHNFATPLLRYEIGDTATLGPPCPCGRHLPVLTRIAGRILDLLTLPDGTLRRTDFNHYRLSQIHAVREYQIVQRTPTNIEILLVTARPLASEETDEVRAIMATEFTEGFTLTVTEVPAIPRTEAGKLRPFRTELPTL